MPTSVSVWPARLDLLQSLSGLLLVIFVWAHMFFESSILLGKDAMYKVSRMFEGEPLFGEPYPLLVSAVGVAVFLLVAAHAVSAMRKFPGSSRQYRELHQHIGAMRHPDTTLWYMQCVTGFLLFFLISAHLYMVIVQPDNIGPYASADRIWSGRFWILYALLLVTVHVHAGAGLYRLVLKWGLIPGIHTKANRVRLKRVLAGIVIFFIGLGTASLITYMRIGFLHSDNVGERYQPDVVEQAMEGR